MSEKSTTDNIAASHNDLNKLRASVLGANDGIVSTAGIVLGVAGSSASKESIVIAGIAGLVSGAISMAAGEYVSVSSQRDSEKAFLAKYRAKIAKNQASVAKDLAEIYVQKGLSKQTADLVAAEFQKKDLLAGELEKESGVEADDISSPWAAAIASAISFVVGASVPLLAMVLAPTDARVWLTALAVLVSLILTGTLSARAGKANQTAAALRVVIWGVGAMAITYAIGHVIGVNIS